MIGTTAVQPVPCFGFRRPLSPWSPMPILYLSYEPDNRMIADRIEEFPRSQDNLDAYDARARFKPDDPASDSTRRAVAAQIAAADVLVCVIGQTTFLDPWIDWELRAYVAKPDRHGLVGIMLHDLNTPPPAMIGRGSIFINFKKDALEAAVEAALTTTDLTEDFVIDE